MEGPRRFRCPPEFEAVAAAPCPGPRGAALAGPGTELWLIRAPADFYPESLEGCPVPLDGCSQLPPPGAGDSDRGGQGRLYGLRGGPLGGGPSSLLLLGPDGPGGPLAAAPPLCGRLTISESFGPPPGSPPPPRERSRRRKKVTKELPEVPEVSPPGGGDTQGPGPPQATEVTPGDPAGPERKKKKKKKKKHKSEWPE